MRTSSIACLFEPSRPVAIVWGVWAVIVAAFDCMFRRRTRSHVGIKNGHTVAPTVAHGDAASTVVAKVLVAWIQAAVDHVHPCSVFGGIAQAVLGGAFAASSDTHTSAGCGVPAGETTGPCGHFFAADAATAPEESFRFHPRWGIRQAENRQVPVDVPCVVDHAASHCQYYSIFG